MAAKQLRQLDFQLCYAHMQPCGLEFQSSQETTFSCFADQLALTQQTSKGDAWRDAGEEDEDGSHHALEVETVLQVADVVWVTPLDVVDKSTKWPPCALEWVNRDVRGPLFHQGCGTTDAVPQCQ